VCIYSVFRLCVGSGLAMGWSSVQRVLLTVYEIKKLKWNKNVSQMPYAPKGVTGIWMNEIITEEIVWFHNFNVPLSAVYVCESSRTYFVFNSVGRTEHQQSVLASSTSHLQYVSFLSLSDACLIC
jgi:hypothetical protein